MDFETRFNELSSQPKDEDLIQELIILQEESLKENDADVYLKTSHLLFDTYVNLGDYDLATSLFFSILKENRFEAYKTVLEIIDKLVGLLLKTEDFKQLENLLKLRERYLPGTPTPQLMQKFYMAVCQEGQKLYREAIQTLVGITDNISNNNLVSKYLKLSMLYIKTKDFEASKAAFERAKIFDKQLKNEMFYLVASDLAYYEEDYEEALKQFQAFFIKTKVKTRYLDRYIYINIELNRLGEAWRFYKEYLPKIAKSASKNYRLQYYQAGLILSNKVNDIDEAAVLHERIRSLETVNEEIVDTFDGIKTLLAFSAAKIRFKSKRDIILELYRVLASLSDFDRILYLFPSNDGLVLYTFKKGLLMEKTFTLSQYRNTLLEEIINQDLPFHLFSKEDILKQVDYLTNTAFVANQYSTILAYKIMSMQTTDGYMITFMEKDKQFDYINRLLQTTKSILEEKLTVQKLLDHHETLHRLSERLLSMKGLGLYKLEDGILFLQNTMCHQQLETDSDFIAFEDFQKRMEGPLIYIDDLLRKDHLEIKIKRSNGSALLSIDLWQVDRTIYLLAEDIAHEIENTETLSLLAHLTETYSMNNLHALRNSIEAMTDVSCLLGFWILSNSLADLKRKDRHHLIEQLRNLIHASARNQLICLALDEEEGLLLHCLSTDKRVHQRIAKDVIDGMNEFVNKSFNIYQSIRLHIGAIILQKNMLFYEILEKLDRTRFADIFEIAPVYYDKSLIAIESKFSMLFDQFQDFVSARNMPLVFSEIGNLLTKKIEGYDTSIDPFCLHGTIHEYQKMIAENHLEKEHFQLHFQSVISLLSKMATEINHTVRMMIDLPKIALFDAKLIEEIVKRIKRSKLSLELIIFKIHGIESVESQLESFRYLKEKGCSLAFQVTVYDAIKLMSEHPSIVDFLMIESNELTDSTSLWFDGLNQYRKQQIIITNYNQIEQKDTLMAAKLYLVKGNQLKNNITQDELFNNVK